MWLKGGVPVDTLCRGEVAEWLNAAVSKTVTSVIPASGVRIPPSPRFITLRLRRRLSARFGPFRASLSGRRLRLRQAASQLGSAQREKLKC